MEVIKLNKKTGEVVVGTATVRSGKPQYSILLRGHTSQDYDVSPYCFVTITPETAADWLRRLDALHAVPGASHISSVTFNDAPTRWFSGENEYLAREADVAATVQEILAQDSVLLDKSQVPLVEAICQDSDFRASCDQLCLMVNTRLDMRKHEGVYFTTYEKHCDVEITTAMIYRHDLEKMAGKLYKKQRSK